jgi:hypothetical protein
MWVRPALDGLCSRQLQRYRVRVSLGLRLCLLALLAPPAITGCAAADEQAFDDRTIEGSVVDEFDAQAIAGAKVSFVSDALDRAEATSDGAGRFSIAVELSQGVRFGTLVASHSDYVAGSQRSVYFDGTALRVELSLRPK